MELTAREIQEKQFHDAWRGYRQEEVDDFLDQISEALDRALRENAALKDRNHELGQAVSTARDTEEMLKKTLVTAQRAAEEAIASAQAKADAIVAEAEERVRRLDGETQERKRIALAEIQERKQASDAEILAAKEEADKATQSTDAEIQKRKQASDAEIQKRKQASDAEIQKRKQASDAEIKAAMEEAEKATEQKRRELQGTIERLEAYEGELKLRLKTFLEQQLEALSVLADRKVARSGGVRAPTQAANRSDATGARVAPYAASAQPGAAKAPAGEAPDPHPEEGHYRRTLRNLFTREEGSASLRPMIGPEDEQVIQLEEEDEGVRVLPKDSGAREAPQEEDRPDQRP